MVSFFIAVAVLFAVLTLWVAVDRWTQASAGGALKDCQETTGGEHCHGCAMAGSTSSGPPCASSGTPGNEPAAS